MLASDGSRSHHLCKGLRGPLPAQVRKTARQLLHAPPDRKPRLLHASQRRLPHLGNLRVCGNPLPNQVKRVPLALREHRPCRVDPLTCFRQLLRIWRGVDQGFNPMVRDRAKTERVTRRLHPPRQNLARPSSHIADARVITEAIPRQPNGLGDFVLEVKPGVSRLRPLPRHQSRWKLTPQLSAMRSRSRVSIHRGLFFRRGPLTPTPPP